MLQEILAALKTKETEMKKEHGSDYQDEPPSDENQKFNPITGGEESGTEERADASGKFQFFCCCIFECLGSSAIVSEVTRISLASDSCRRQGTKKCFEGER